MAEAELSGKQGEGRRHHQRPEPVPRAAHPGDQSGGEERPGGGDRTRRTKRVVFGTLSIWTWYARTPSATPAIASATWIQRVAVMRASSHGRAAESTGRAPASRPGNTPRRVPSAPGYRREAPLVPSGHDEYQLTYRSRWRFGDRPHLDQDLARRALEIALYVVVAAALTGAWLAFFTFVPFDLRVH